MSADPVRLGDLKAVVAQAKEESDVLRWVSAHADLSGVEAYNERLDSITIEDWADDDKAQLAQYHPVMHRRPR